MARRKRTIKHRGSESKSVARWNPRNAAVAVVAITLGGLAFWWQQPRSPSRAQSTGESLTLPSERHITDGPQRSAIATGYVGSRTCAECHVEQDRSYRQTAHSMALADVAPDNEPLDASFCHEASGRTYTVYREGEQLHHREAMLDGQGSEIAASDYPVRYLIGSGRHTRSYLVEIDGFLCESPLTWYASRQTWEMSPGYDSPYHRGFERAAESGCLYCHVGRLADDRAYQHLRIVEQAIGCERCHGPGASHVAEQRVARKGDGQAKTSSPTIVNPARLSRELSEAVCAQCHLNTDAIAIVRGRELSDFRPGMTLTDVCINYCRQEANSQMTVVGHVEQMRLSKCYQGSETLTCTTCHDPHAEMERSEKRAFAMQVCINCHTEQACTLALAKRLQHPSGNDCIACHMPQVDTEIRHIAFTHHRIGIHAPTTGEDATVDGSSAVAELVPLDEPEGLSQIDRDRNLGLAYFSLSQKQTDSKAATAYRERARGLLEAARSRGDGDPEMAAALVRMCRDTDADAALQLAQEALSSGALAARSEINCMFFMSEWGLQRGQPQVARQALERLTDMRLLSEDWLLLGLCRQRIGDWSGAGSALERASQLAPLRANIHNALAHVYERLGQEPLAQRQREVASRLTERKPNAP